MDNYLITIDSGEQLLLAENEGVGRLADINHDHTKALVERVAYRGDNNVYLVDISKQKDVLITAHDPPGAFHNARFSDNDSSIYLIANANRDMRYLGRIASEDIGTADGIQILVERHDAELEEFSLSADENRGVLIWNVAGRSELSLYDFRTGTVTDISELPGSIVQDVTFSPDDAQIAMVILGATQPADIWTMDLESHEFQQITHSPHPGVTLAELVEPELAHYPAHDNLDLTGWLFTPPNFQRPGPVVLNFHGGPEGQERPVFRAIYQALLSQGIAVLGPNVRGSSGFGKRFLNLDNGELRFNAIKDIESSVSYLINSGIAQRGQIGIMGGSYGGYMTMAGLSQYPELFAAGVNIYGVVNFSTFFQQTEPWMANISKVIYGDPDTQADLLYELSPINHLDRVIAPTLVLHGANDTNVPVVEAEQVVDKLRDRGVDVKYILFPDEGHGFLKETNRITADVAIVQWFAKYLKP